MKEGPKEKTLEELKGILEVLNSGRIKELEKDLLNIDLEIIALDLTDVEHQSKLEKLIQRKDVLSREVARLKGERIDDRVMNKPHFFDNE